MLLLLFIETKLGSHHGLPRERKKRRSSFLPWIHRKTPKILWQRFIRRCFIRYCLTALCTKRNPCPSCPPSLLPKLSFRFRVKKKSHSLGQEDISRLPAMKCFSFWKTFTSKPGIPFRHRTGKRTSRASTTFESPAPCRFGLERKQLRPLPGPFFLFREIPAPCSRRLAKGLGSRMFPFPDPYDSLSADRVFFKSFPSTSSPVGDVHHDSFFSVSWPLPPLAAFPCDHPQAGFPVQLFTRKSSKRPRFKAKSASPLVPAGPSR